MGLPEYVTVQLRRLCCSECGVVYAVAENYMSAAQAQGRGWKCPNGHGQWYGDSPLEARVKEAERRLASEAQARKWAEERAERERANALSAQRSARAYKGQVSRVKKGVCPYCKRSFTDLRRHMECKHDGQES